MANKLEDNENKTLLEKFKGAARTFVGKKFKTKLMAIALVGSIGMGAVSPAFGNDKNNNELMSGSFTSEEITTLASDGIEIDPDWSADRELTEQQKMQNEKEEFNASYTLKDQKLILAVGNFINTVNDNSNSDFRDAIETVDQMKIDFLNQNMETGIRAANFSSADFAELVVDQYADGDLEKLIEDTPNFIINAADVVLPSLDSFSPEDQNKIMLKAMLSSEDGFSSREDAYESIKEDFLGIARWNGGVESGDFEKNTGDVNFEHDKVKEAFLKFATSNVTKEQVNEHLSNHLRTPTETVSNKNNNKIRNVKWL